MDDTHQQANGSSNDNTSLPLLDQQFGGLSASLLAIVLGGMTVCGVVGNVLVILSVALNRKLRTVTNCFIVSLAVADLLVAVFVMPISAIVEITGEWMLGSIICWVYILADVFLCTSSIWNLLIISLERCMAISWPLWYGSRRSKRVAYILIAIAWLVSMVICVPPLFLQGILEGATADGHCHYAIDQNYRIYSACGSFWIPLAIILFCYVRIFSVANKKDKVLDQQTHQTASATPGSSGWRPATRPLAIKFPVYTRSSNPSSVSLDVDAHAFENVHSTFMRAASITETPLTSSTALIEIHLGSAHHSNGSLVAAAGNNGVTLPVSGDPIRFRQDSQWSIEERHKSQLLARNNTKSASVYKQHSKDRERKVFKVLLIILCSFVACWMGFFVIYTLEPFCAACKEIDKRIYAFFLWLGYFNSMLNPLIYAGFSHDFRRAFLNILLCATCRKRTFHQLRGRQNFKQ